MVKAPDTAVLPLNRRVFEITGATFSIARSGFSAGWCVMRSVIEPAVRAAVLSCAAGLAVLIVSSPGLAQPNDPDAGPIGPPSIEIVPFEVPEFEVPEFDLGPLEIEGIDSPPVAEPAPLPLPPAFQDASEREDQRPAEAVEVDEVDTRQPTAMGLAIQVIPDSYIVTVKGRFERDRHFISEQYRPPRGVTTEIIDREVRGPLVLTVRLTAQGRPLVDWEIAEWDRNIEIWSSRFANATGPYAPIRSLVQDKIDIALSLRTDVAMLLRVQQAEQVYHYDPETSGPFRVTYEGGYFERTVPAFDGFTPPSDIGYAEEEPWSALHNRLSTRGRGVVYLGVWRFSPSDMAQIEDLAARIEDLRSQLTLDFSGVQMTTDERALADITEDHFHDAFRDGLLRGLINTISRAWHYSPATAPAGIWALKASQLDAAYDGTLNEDYLGYMPDGLDASRPSGHTTWARIRRDVPLRLPPKVGSAFYRLSLPQLGFSPDAGGAGIDVPSWLRDCVDCHYAAVAAFGIRHRVTNARDPSLHDNVELFANAAGTRFNGAYSVTLDESDEFLSEGRSWGRTDTELATLELDWIIEHEPVPGPDPCVEDPESCGVPQAITVVERWENDPDDPEDDEYRQAEQIWPGHPYFVEVAFVRTPPLDAYKVRVEGVERIEVRRAPTTTSGSSGAMS